MMQKRRDGFSLVETVVGMLVGTVALIALAGVMISTAQVQGLSLSRMELVGIGEAKLDALRSYAALRRPDTVQIALGGSLTSNVANHYEQITSARGRMYVLRWTVVSGINGTRDVTLRVAAPAARPNELGQLDFKTLMAVE
ncbi:MAG: type IV pilus modification PilV family protein [Longimicrobiales bacterium]